jgi:hypothetical protein
MNSKRPGGDPVAYAIIIVGFAALALLAIFTALIIAVPAAIITIGGVLSYRYWRLQKFKSKDYLPTTIKERPTYLEPKRFFEAIEIDRWLLNDAEEETGKYSCQSLASTFHYVVAQLYAQESFHEAPLAPDTTDRITLARYHDELGAWQRKVSDNNNFELFVGLLVQCYMAMREHFPSYAFQDSAAPINSNISTALQISDEPQLVSQLIGGFFDADFKKRKLFVELRSQIERNAEETADEPTLKSYFAQTPFRAFAKVEIPVPLHDETRFAGMWTVAPQGMGKTTLLHSMLADDLKKDAAIILMDSKGDLIEPFLTNPALEGRRIIIGPDNPVGMNPLDIPQSDINKAVENLEYLFASLLDFKLTATQSMLLKVVLRSLVTAFPNPTLATFQAMLAEDGPDRFAEHIQKLEPDLRNFLLGKEWHTDNIRGRRQELLQRLRLLLDHDLLRSMLMASSSTFNIGKAMDEGAVIIINNSRGKLGNKGAEFFGRFFIAQVLAAAQQRSFRAAKDKKPVYFYIDECHTVIQNDERITDILHECRSQKIALILAHQETRQVDDHVLSALQNCAIRFAHPDEEAPKLAQSLRMETKKLRSMKRGQFAAYIRGLSDEGIVVNVHRADLSHMESHKAQVTQQTRFQIAPVEKDTVAAKMPEPAVSSPPPQDQAPRPETTASKARVPKSVPSSPPDKNGDPDPGEPASDWT